MKVGRLPLYITHDIWIDFKTGKTVELSFRRNLEESLSLVWDRMRVVNVGAARVMIILIASMSFCHSPPPEIFSFLNDEKSESDRVSGPIFENNTLTRVSDSRWWNAEKNDSGKFLMLSK